MKAINKTTINLQNSTLTETRETLYKYLAQAKGTLFFVTSHLAENNRFMFSLDLTESTLWNVECLLRKTHKLLSDVVLNKNCNHIIEVDEISKNLAQSKGILAFVIGHIQDNNGLLASPELTYNVLWNVETLINNSLESLDLIGGGNE